MIGAITAGLFATGAPPVSPTSYESIATVTLGSAQSSIEFTSIPSTFKHLQVRGIARSSRTGVNFDDVTMTLNSDTGSNYSRHRLFGNPASPSSTVLAEGSANNSQWQAGVISSADAASNIFGTLIVDILDYTNTNKYKTLRILSGVDTNGAVSGYAGFVALASSAWLNTSAVTTVKLLPFNGPNFTQYSSFALYGIKG
jgi:hypothetical protein